MSTSSIQPESGSNDVQPETSGGLAISSQAGPSELQRPAVRDAMAKLPLSMRQAFVLTTQGASPKAIIEEVGITRVTLHRWKKYNPMFRAAINAWHQDQVESTQLGMVAMLPEAMETIRTQIKYNSSLAFKVVDKAGGFAPPPRGTISPRQMRKQIKLELRREKLRMRKRLEKVHLQEVNQRAQELEDKLEEDRIEKMRKMDPEEVNRIRDFNARVDELAERLRENRKDDPDFKFDETYVRSFLYPEEYRKEKLRKIEESTAPTPKLNRNG